MGLELTDEQRSRLTPDEAAQVDAYAQWLRGVQENPISYIKNKPPISQDTLRRLVAKANPSPDAPGGALEDLEEDVGISKEERDKYLDELGYDLNALEGATAAADSQDNATFGTYLDQLGQYEDPLEASEYVGDYESGGEGFDAQSEALDRFRDLSKTEVTGEERFMYEQQRMAEERDRRAAMDAALRDLEARGARSGGAEIAALTGAQDITSQNRLLGDLGTQANAQKRAMLGAQGFARTAGEMRGAEDQVGMFNKELMNDYSTWKDEFTAGERDAAVERAGLGRDAGLSQTDRALGRKGTLYGEKEDYTQLGIGNENQTLGDSKGYTELFIGGKEADAAREELDDDDEGMFGLGLGPF